MLFCCYDCTSKRHKCLYDFALAFWLFSILKIASYEPNKQHLQHLLLFLFNHKKNSSESQQNLVRCFRRFRNGDFHLIDKKCPDQQKKFEDAKLQALLDEDNPQTQQQLAEKLNVGR